MDKKIVQISVEDLKLNTRGTIKGEEDTNIFRFTLSYPCEGIPSLETVKTIKANVDLPTDWSADLDKSIIFKTSLRGKAKLSVEVTSVDKDSKAEAFIKKLFKSTFGAVLGVWTGGLSNAYVGAATQSFGSSMIDLVEDKNAINILGEATFIIDSEKLPSNLKETDLIAPKDVCAKEYKTKKSTSPKHRSRGIKYKKSKKVTLVKAKEANGSIKIKVVEIG